MGEEWKLRSGALKPFPKWKKILHLRLLNPKTYDRWPLHKKCSIAVDIADWHYQKVQLIQNGLFGNIEIEK